MANIDGTPGVKKRSAPNYSVLKNYNQLKMADNDWKKGRRGKQDHFAPSNRLSTLVTELLLFSLTGRQDH